MSLEIEREFSAAYDANCQHRRGHRLQDLSAKQVAWWIVAEANELANSVQALSPNVSEAGDVLVLLVHLARLCGWSLRDIDLAAVKKLRLRHGLSERVLEPENGQGVDDGTQEEEQV